MKRALQAAGAVAMAALLALLAVPVAAAAAPSVLPEGRVRETHPFLGTLLEITVEGADRDAAQDAVLRAVNAGRRVEELLDPGDPNGVLARLHAMAGRGPVYLPLDLYRLLSLSLLMTRSTGGAFDVTVAPLLQRRRPLEGSPERDGRRSLSEALALVGPGRVVLHPPDRAELVEPGVALDFRWISGGYILERMAASLRRDGIEAALLRLSDTVAVAVGPPADRDPWRLRVTRGPATIGSVALRDRALSTRRVPAGRRDGSDLPVIDPRSGRLVDTDREATVIARDAALAEAWSTALVVDPDGALLLLGERRDVETLLFDGHGEHRSPRFDRWSAWQDAPPPGRRLRGDATPSALP